MTEKTEQTGKFKLKEKVDKLKDKINMLKSSKKKQKTENSTKKDILSKQSNTKNFPSKNLFLC